MSTRDAARPAPHQNNRLRKLVRDYFVAVKRPLRTAVDTRQEWVADISALFEEARGGNQTAVIHKAGGVGRRYLPVFRQCQHEVEVQQAPEPCIACHQVLVEWMQRLVQASEALVDVGNTQSLSGLQACQEHLTEARYAARAFNRAQMDILRAYGLIKK